MNILFRCDGSVEIGMGHVVRCLALADHLRDSHDCSVWFAMRRSELGINKVKESYPVMLSNEKGFNYKEWLTDCIEKTNAKVLIMEDVITTGKSSMECVKLITKSRAKLVGFASIIDRSTKKSLKIKKGIVSHMKIEVPAFKSNNLPDYLKSMPITVPGSRFIK